MTEPVVDPLEVVDIDHDQWKDFRTGPAENLVFKHFGQLVPIEESGELVWADSARALRSP